MTLVTTDAVVLHAFDYLETSRIVRLATRDAGVQSVIARGARRSSRRFGAALDLFATGSAEIHLKSGRDLQQLATFDVTQARSALGLDLDRFASASMLAELGMRFSAGDEHGALFTLLTSALDRLLGKHGGDARVAGLGCAWHLVSALGFSPSIDICSNCHEPVPPADAVLFSHPDGGIVCELCGRQVRGGRRIPDDARRVLRQWIAGEEADVPDPKARRAHARLLREFAVHHVSDGAELRAFESWIRRFGDAA